MNPDSPSPVQRPIPVPTPLSAPFWQGCAEGELRYQECEDCGRAIFKPQDFCPNCLGIRLTWRESSGIGEVYSYSVVWRPQTPAFDVPYVVAIVELAEGYQMLTNVVNCEPDAVYCGMPVSVVFAPVADDIALPFFAPSSA